VFEFFSGHPYGCVRFSSGWLEGLLASGRVVLDCYGGVVTWCYHCREAVRCGVVTDTVAAAWVVTETLAVAALRLRHVQPHAREQVICPARLGW
jgi:hypothetical protein